MFIDGRWEDDFRTEGMRDRILSSTVRTVTTVVSDKVIRGDAELQMFQ